MRGSRSTPRRRAGFTIIEIMIVIFIIGVISAIAQPAYKVYRDNAMTRACFKTQKTISSALQNFNLDSNQSRKDLPDVLPELVTKGYLQNLPTDPGSGPDSHTNYTYTSEGFNVECVVHGILR